jgi:hypothetical protein
MAAPIPRERQAYRPRWRPVPDSRSTPPSGRTAHAPGRHMTRQNRALSRTAEPDMDVPVVDLAALGLPQLFTPAQAAEILRNLGLTEITEAALRSRAYRRQIPFHLNGRKITFTASDLREIAEGQARRPEPAAVSLPKPAAPPASRRSPQHAAGHPQVAWRARPDRKSDPTRDAAR